MTNCSEKVHTPLASISSEPQNVVTTTVSSAGIVSVHQDVQDIYNYKTQLLSTELFQSAVGNDFYSNLMMSEFVSNKENLKLLLDFHSSVKNKTKQLFSDDGSLFGFHQHEIEMQKLAFGPKSVVAIQSNIKLLDQSFKVIENVIQSLSEVEDDKDLLVIWKSEKVSYQRALWNILENENREFKMLEIPSIALVYLFNENPENLKRSYGGYAKSSIGIPLRKYIGRISEKFDQRNRIFNSVLNTSLYSIAYFSGRECVNAEGEKDRIINESNIHSIEDFSKEKIFIDWCDMSAETAEMLKRNDSYHLLNQWIPHFQTLSKSRDMYYTLMLLTQNYFIVSGFDAVF